MSAAAAAAAFLGPQWATCRSGTRAAAVAAAAANRFIGFFSFAHHRVASTRVAMK